MRNFFIGFRQKESIEQVATSVLAAIAASGYGTDRPDRWSPCIDVVDVKALAEAVLAAGTPRGGPGQ